MSIAIIGLDTAKSVF
jgi:transposase